MQNDAFTDIIILLSSNKWVAPFYERNDMPRTVLTHHILASHYRIATITTGFQMWKTIKDGINTWEKLTRDGNVLADAGHDLYHQIIRSYLLPFLAVSNSVDTNKPHAIPLSIHGNMNRHADIVDAWDIAPDSCVREDKPLGGRYIHQLVATSPGSGLTFPCTGTAIGLWWMIAHDGGDIHWHIDDDKPQRLSSWDKNAPKGDRPGAVILTDNLEPGDHLS